MNKWICVLLVGVLMCAFSSLSLVRAQSASDMETFFSREYAGITVVVSATRETVPGANMTINLWVNCTADGLNVDYLNLSLYGFRGGSSRILLNTWYPLTSTAMDYNATLEFNYDLQVPADVWDTTAGELSLRYSIFGQPLGFDPSFSVTVVRNVYYEQLQEDYANLNQTYHELNDSFSLLNSSYWGLQQNLTSLSGAMVDLENTRRVVAILVVISVFFVVTTMYLMLRRPRVYV